MNFARRTARPRGEADRSFLPDRGLSSALGRVGSLDSVRGLAIALMVPANAAADWLAPPHPFGLRLAGSFAAPIFVFLAGMMIGLGSGRFGRCGPAGLRRAAGRGAFLMLIGALLDAGLGGIWPFQTCDVLYLIGLALPIGCLVAALPAWGRWATPLAILAATPLLQASLGYRVGLNTPSLDVLDPSGPAPLGDVALRFLIDGWFPAFPWLGLALLGTAVGQLRGEGRSLRRARGAGWALLVTGAVAWWASPGEMAARCGYSELFYRPTPGFLATALGAVLLALDAFERPIPARLGRWLEPLGRCSLLLYIAHLVAIHAIAARLDDDLAPRPFLALSTALLAGLLLLALAVDALKALLREQGVRLPGVAALVLGS